MITPPYVYTLRIQLSPMARGFKRKRSRSGPRGSFNWRSWGGAALGTGASIYSAASRTRQNVKKRSNPLPITGESDWRRVYTRRRMPRLKRRRWVRFSKKVKYVVDKQIAPKFNVFTRGETFTSLANFQGIIPNHTVLGANGSSPHTNDISDLVKIAQAIMPLETTDPSTNLDAWRIKVTGWMIESSITNNSPHTIYIDMYYWRTKRDVPTTIGNVVALWAESVSDVSRNTGVAANALSISDYGVTPFQGTQFAKNCTVWRKQRVKLSAGGTTQIEQRSGRNYMFDFGFAEHYSMLRNATEGIMFVFYGSPDTTNVLARSASITVSTNVNYTWKVLLSGRTSGAEQDNP